jgi:hypothetical protein
MKNPTTKQKLRAVFKAALFGTALSLGFSFYVQHYFEGTTDFALDLLFMIPTTILSNILGLETPKWGSLVNSFAFMVIANGLLVTFIFVVFAFFWQFVVKGHSKNQTTGIE